MTTACTYTEAPLESYQNQIEPHTCWSKSVTTYGMYDDPGFQGRHKLPGEHNGVLRYRQSPKFQISSQNETFETTGLDLGLPYPLIGQRKLLLPLAGLFR